MEETIKKNSRNIVVVSEHLLAYEDDPLKLLYQKPDGQLNWIKFCPNQFAQSSMTTTEQKIVQKLRPLYDDVVANKDLIIEGIVQYFPNMANHFSDAKVQDALQKQVAKEQEKQVQQQETMLNAHEVTHEIVTSTTVEPAPISANVQMGLPTNPMSMIMNMDEALKLYELFELAKRKLLKPTDFQIVKNRRGDAVGRFIKKSGWKKLGTFFGVSTEVIDSKVFRDEDGDPYATVTVRATWGNRSQTDTGTYSKKEMEAKRQPYNLSNMISTAVTRASNRAVSDIIGGGEVSAEEMSGGEDFANNEQN